MVSILDGIMGINANARAIVEGTDIDDCTITWLEGTAEISKSNIKTKMAELQTAYDNNAYQRVRATAYPTWQEQMDLQYKDLLNGTTTWKDAVAKVKSDNPKE
jgi:hypothetical protein